MPFCAAICSYCNFNRGLLDEELKQRYVIALVREIERGGDGSRVDSIFFGGGTPSLLAVEEVTQVLDACRGSFEVVPDVEVTLEMNPESCGRSYVSALLGAGVNRISLGVQSFDDEELVRLGRAHTAAQARAAFAAVRDAGCDNVSLDLMLWLPGQSRAACAASVEALLSLEPDHASLYMLELYPNAPLQEEAARRGWSQAPDEDAAAMYLDALFRTDAAGYRQYEISNVARPGRFSRHNLKYWRDGEWLGFGCGAHSTRAGFRWKNVSDTVCLRGCGRAGRAGRGGTPPPLEGRAARGCADHGAAARRGRTPGARRAALRRRPAGAVRSRGAQIRRCGVDGRCRRPVAPHPRRHAGVERGRGDFRLTWAVR